MYVVKWYERKIGQAAGLFLLAEGVRGLISIKTGSAMPRQVYYVCNRKKCEHCAADCHHTKDLAYALYDEHPEDQFEFYGSPDHGVVSIWEKVRRTK